MLRVSVFSVLLGLVCAPVAAQQRQPPDEPEQPFKVFIYTEGLTNEHVNMPKVAEQVAERIGKKDDWLEVVNARDDADIVVEVLTHAVHERHRTRLEPRVNATGVGKSWVDENFVTEEHVIESRVNFPDGTQRLIRGIDDRDRGGSVKGAASKLADDLEDHCKENYWKLIGT